MVVVALPGNLLGRHNFCCSRFIGSFTSTSPLCRLARLSVFYYFISLPAWPTLILFLDPLTEPVRIFLHDRHARRHPYSSNGKPFFVACRNILCVLPHTLNNPRQASCSPH